MTGAIFLARLAVDVVLSGAVLGEAWCQNPENDSLFLGDVRKDCFVQAGSSASSQHMEFST
jgi:hypothetical protein